MEPRQDDASTGPDPAGGSGSVLEHRARDFETLRRQFGQLRLSAVVPLAFFLKDQSWNVLWVRWFLVYAIVPFLLLHLLLRGTIGTTDLFWAFGSYFALTWLIVLSTFMRPVKPPLGQLIKVGLFTIVIGIPILLAASSLPFVRGLQAGTQSGSTLARLTGFTLGVGLLEEMTKAAPVFLFLYRKQLRYPPLTYAYFGVVSGLAFGVAEAVNYSVSYTGIAASGAVDVYLVLQLLRMISLPLLHACWAGIVAYFIGLAAVHRSAASALMLIGIGLAATLHGVYNTTTGGFGSVLVATFSLLIFVTYVRAGDRLAESVLYASAPGASDTVAPGAGATASRSET